MSLMVEFKNVTKRYGELTVLDELNLAVETDEKVAIIGPSGSGKTTVLRMLMTLERIDSGVIYVDGVPLTHMEKKGHLVVATRSTCARCVAESGWSFSISIFSRIRQRSATVLRRRCMYSVCLGTRLNNAPMICWTWLAYRTKKTIIQANCQVASSRGWPLPGPWQ